MAEDENDGAVPGLTKPLPGFRLPRLPNQPLPAARSELLTPPDHFKVMNWTSPSEGRTSSKRSLSSSDDSSSAPVRPPPPVRHSARLSSKLKILNAASAENARESLKKAEASKVQRFRVLATFIAGQVQKYSLPLVFGVLTALTWNNIDEHSYHDFTEGPLAEGAALFGSDLHGLSLHFIVNDIFMCFFFGLAIKEVTEALLPGGSLSPLKRAINPLLATVGGVVGPVAVYILMVLVLFAAGTFDGYMCSSGAASGGAHRRLGLGAAATGPAAECTLAQLIEGWGIPTATDISLAWMFALLIFGCGHPAINFMLLLAIVDDAIGMIIIAAAYPDPVNPVQPEWLGLVVAGMVLAFVLRKLKVPSWPVYVGLCGPVSWLGLFKSHVHPALALVFIVPFMPAAHALEADPDECNLGACDLGAPRKVDSGIEEKRGSSDEPHKADMTSSKKMAKFATTLKLAATTLLDISDDEAPLHQFEAHAKLPVDLGMFFFGLANAGVPLGGVGGITAAVGVALLVGKTLGIAGFSLLGRLVGFDLPQGVTVGDLFAMSAIAGVGLTVALFVANEAFVDATLRGEAKMGAVLSIACGGVGAVIRSLARRRS